METKLDNTTEPQHNAKLPVMCWVAISENKPEAGQWLLVYASSGRHIAWYNGFQFEDRAGYNIEGVTHWMQIPEPPCALRKT